MTLPEFKAVMVVADPTITHYFGAGTGNYSVWAEYGDNRLVANNKTAERAIKVQVDRYTKIENDPVVDAITAALDENEIAYEYLVDTEVDTRYMHHIWDCEVI